jgi:hypothetical protein
MSVVQGGNRIAPVAFLSGETRAPRARSSLRSASQSPATKRVHASRIFAWRRTIALERIRAEGPAHASMHNHVRAEDLSEIPRFNDPPNYRLVTKGVDPSSAHFSFTIGDISG